jgi:hypothetical protein
MGNGMVEFQTTLDPSFKQKVFSISKTKLQTPGLYYSHWNVSWVLFLIILD